MTVPVSRLEEEQSLTPQARPVDRHVTVDVSSQTQQFAKSLTLLGGAAAALGLTYAKKKQEADFKAGQDYAYENADITAATMPGDSEEAKAVREGVLPPGRSKAFMKGAASVAGQRYAMKYNMDFTVYMKAQGEQANTPEDLANIAAELDVEWRKKNLSTELSGNDDFMASFSRRITEGQYNTLLGQMTEQESRAMRQAEEDGAGMAYNLATEALASTAASRWDDFNTRVTSLREQLYGMGMRGEVANRIVYDSIAKAAIDAGDPSPIEYALEHNINGADLPPLIVANLRAAAVDAHRRGLARREEDRAKNEDKAKVLYNQYADELAKSSDPELVDVGPYVEQLRAIDPASVRGFLAFRDELLQARDIDNASHSNAQIFAELRGHASNAKTVLSGLLAQGHITRAQYREWAPYAENMEADTRPSSNRGLRFSIIDGYSTTLARSLRGKDFETAEVDEEVALFSLAANDMLMRDPNMSELEARTQISNLLKQYIADVEKRLSQEAEAARNTMSSPSDQTQPAGSVPVRQ